MSGKDRRQVSGEGGGQKRQARVLKGFRDYLPEQMILRQRIIGIFRDIFERHGFEPLDTPALEYLDVLTGKAGENEKLMYRFEDAGGRGRAALRPDRTPGPRGGDASERPRPPFKRYQIAPVWRAENPQRGRFREFWQCDADIAGSASPLADAEVIAIMAEALEGSASRSSPSGSATGGSWRAWDAPPECRQTRQPLSTAPSTSSTRSDRTGSRASWPRAESAPIKQRVCSTW